MKLEMETQRAYNPRLVTYGEILFDNFPIRAGVIPADIFRRAHPFSGIPKKPSFAFIPRGILRAGIKEWFLVKVFSGIILFFTAYAAYAQTADFTGSAGSEVDGSYIVTIKKIEISQDNLNWVVLGEAEQLFNIASASVGGDIGGYVSNSSIPVGTYNYLRITQSRVITIKGRSGNQSGNYYYTTTAGGTNPGGFYFAKNIAVGSWPAADYEAVPFQVPDDATGGAGETIVISGNDMIITRDLSATPMVFREGVTKTMVVSFNTANMIGFQSAPGGYIFYPMAPQQSYSEE